MKEPILNSDAERNCCCYSRTYLRSWRHIVVINIHALRRLAEEVLKSAARLTAAATMRNPVAQTVRNVVGRLILGLSAVKHAFADNLTEVSIGYSHSPLNGPSLSSTPRVGARVVPLPDCSPAGSGPAPRFALFAQKSEMVDGLIGRFTELLEGQVRPAIVQNGIWLVRPDGYVACSSQDPGVIATYLDGLRAQ